MIPTPNPYSAIFGTHEGWQVALVVTADARRVVGAFYDSVKRPNLTGAIGTAKVDAVRGHQAFLTLPENESGMLEGKKLPAEGSLVTVCVSNYVPPGGKAWPVRVSDIQPQASVIWHEPAPGVMRQAMEHYNVSLADMREDDDFITDWLAHHTGIEELESGARLTVEQTAAVATIDLDTGSLQGINNIIAALGPAIASAIQQYQLGGAIIVDAAFLPGGARDGLADKLAKLLLADPLKANVIGTTKMGLIEITRPRISASRLEVSV